MTHNDVAEKPHICKLKDESKPAQLSRTVEYTTCVSADE